MDKARETVELLTGHWLARTAIQHLPGRLEPHGMKEVRDVHRAFIASQQSCGWKVGPAPGGGALCASPLRGAAIASPYRLDEPADFLIELEIALVLGAPVSANASRGDALAAIGCMHMACELLRSRFLQPMRQSVFARLADNLNNTGVVLGTGSVVPSDNQIDGAPIHLVRESESVGTGTVPPLSDLLDQLRWLAGYADQCGTPLAAGDVIITGARIGPLTLKRSGVYTAHSPLGHVTINVL